MESWIIWFFVVSPKRLVGCTPNNDSTTKRSLFEASRITFIPACFGKNWKNEGVKLTPLVFRGLINYILVLSFLSCDINNYVICCDRLFIA